MADLSLRGLDETTTKRLRSEAKRRGLSVNSLVIQLIREGVGTKRPEVSRAPFGDLDKLAGTWSKDEADQFMKAVADFEQIDRDLWQ